MSANQKVLVCLDGSNLFHAISSLGSKDNHYRINYQALLDLFEKEVGTVVKKFYFSAEPAGKIRDDRAKYVRCLKSMGLDVRSVPLKVKHQKCKGCGADFDTFVEKGVDVALSCEALRYGYQGLATAIVIVSGSGVYLPIVEALQGAGIFVVIASFKQHCTVSEDLWTKADKTIDLSNYVEDLRLKFEPKEQPKSPKAISEAIQDKSPYDNP